MHVRCSFRRSTTLMSRLTDRLKGLTDDEYFWKPGSNCWTVTESSEGYRKEWEELPDGAVEPVTTIAWRLCHISEDVLRAFAASDYLGATTRTRTFRLRCDCGRCSRPPRYGIRRLARGCGHA